MNAVQSNQSVQHSSYDVLMQDGITHHFPIERIPGGLRLSPTFVINMWSFYSHMGRKVYPTIEALLNDACPGWISYDLHSASPCRSKREETWLIKNALAKAGIQAHVRHYLGTIIVEIGRPVESEDWDNIRSIAEEALGEPYKFILGGLHVFDKFQGKLAEGWGRGYRGMFF